MAAIVHKFVSSFIVLLKQYENNQSYLIINRVQPNLHVIFARFEVPQLFHKVKNGIIRNFDENFS